MSSGRKQIQFAGGQDGNQSRSNFSHLNKTILQDDDESAIDKTKIKKVLIGAKDKKNSENSESRDDDLKTGEDGNSVSSKVGDDVGENEKEGKSEESPSDELIGHYGNNQNDADIIDEEERSEDETSNSRDYDNVVDADVDDSDDNDYDSQDSEKLDNELNEYYTKKPEKKEKIQEFVQSMRSNFGSLHKLNREREKRVREAEEDLRVRLKEYKKKIVGYTEKEIKEMDISKPSIHDERYQYVLLKRESAIHPNREYSEIPEGSDYRKVNKVDLQKQLEENDNVSRQSWRKYNEHIIKLSAELKKQKSKKNQSNEKKSLVVFQKEGMNTTSTSTSTATTTTTTTTNTTSTTTPTITTPKRIIPISIPTHNTTITKTNGKTKRNEEANETTSVFEASRPKKSRKVDNDASAPTSAPLNKAAVDKVFDVATNSKRGPYKRNVFESDYLRTTEQSKELAKNAFGENNVRFVEMDDSDPNFPVTNWLAFQTRKGDTNKWKPVEYVNPLGHRIYSLKGAKENAKENGSYNGPNLTLTQSKTALPPKSSKKTYKEKNSSTKTPKNSTSLNISTTTNVISIVVPTNYQCPSCNLSSSDLWTKCLNCKRTVCTRCIIEDPKFKDWCCDCVVEEKQNTLEPWFYDISTLWNEMLENKNLFEQPLLRDDVNTQNKGSRNESTNSIGGKIFTGINFQATGKNNEVAPEQKGPNNFRRHFVKKRKLDGFESNQEEDTEQQEAEYFLHQCLKIRMQAHNSRLKLEVLCQQIEKNRKHIVASMEVNRFCNTFVERDGEPIVDWDGTNIVCPFFYLPLSCSVPLAIQDERYPPPTTPNLLETLCSDKILHKIIQFFSTLFEQIDYDIPGVIATLTELDGNIPITSQAYDGSKKRIQGIRYEESIGDIYPRFSDVCYQGNTLSLKRQYALKFAWAWKIMNMLQLRDFWNSDFRHYGQGVSPNNCFLNYSIRQIPAADDYSTVFGRPAELSTSRIACSHGILGSYVDLCTHQLRIKYALQNGDEVHSDYKGSWNQLIEDRKLISLMDGNYTILIDNTCIGALLGIALMKHRNMLLVETWADPNVEFVDYPGDWTLGIKETDTTIVKRLFSSNLNDFYENLRNPSLLNKLTAERNCALTKKDFSPFKAPLFYRKYYQYVYKQFLVEHLGSPTITFETFEGFKVLHFEELTPLLIRTADATNYNRENESVVKLHYNKDFLFAYGGYRPWSISTTIGPNYKSARYYDEITRDFHSIDMNLFNGMDLRNIPSDLQLYKMMKRYNADRLRGFPKLHKEEYKRMIEIAFPGVTPVEDLLKAYRYLDELGLAGVYQHSPDDLNPHYYPTGMYGADGNLIPIEEVDENISPCDQFDFWLSGNKFVSRPLLKEMLNHNEHLMGLPSDFLETLVLNPEQPTFYQYPDIENLFEPNVPLSRTIKNSMCLTYVFSRMVTKCRNRGRLPPHYLFIEFLGKLWKAKAEIEERTENSLTESELRFLIANGKYSYIKHSPEGVLVELFVEYQLLSTQDAIKRTTTKNSEMYQKFWESQLEIHDPAVLSNTFTLDIEKVRILTKMMYAIKNSGDDNNRNIDPIFAEQLYSDFKFFDDNFIRGVKEGYGEFFEPNEYSIIEYLLDFLSWKEKSKKNEYLNTQEDSEILSKGTFEEDMGDADKIMVTLPRHRIERIRKFISDFVKMVNKRLQYGVTFEELYSKK